MGKDLKGRELGIGLSQRGNGLYSARIKTPDGKRLTHYSSKLNECRRWLSAVIADEPEKEGIVGERCSSVKSPPKETMTVDEWFEIWYETKLPQIRESSALLYRRRYSVDVKHILGEKKLDAVAPLDCQRVLSSLTTKSPKTAALTKLVLGMLFSSAEENGFLQKNPVTKSVKVHRKISSSARNVREKGRILARPEQEALLAYTKGTEYRDIAIVLLQTGLRAGELFSLKKKDIDLDNRILHVEHTLSKTKNGYVCAEPKTGSGKRAIPLTDDVCEVFREKLLSCSENDFIFKKEKKITEKRL